jgi:hypothetical protein
MEVKTGKDAAFHMREYRRRKREDKATHEDFREKRAMESPPSEQEESIAAQFLIRLF